MLEETVLEWEQKALERGRRRGVQEGRREGLLLGTRRTLLRLLARRFGPVPEKVRERIDAISSVRDLETLADRLLTARSLQDLELG